MENTLFLFLLMLQFSVGQLGSPEHIHEDHYIGKQHNPDHDMAVLLGEESTREIKELSPAEQRKKMMAVVEKIDTNGDNLLSAEEITLWIQHVYKQYAIEDANERFTQFDTNINGVVTWEEYSSLAHEQLVTFDDDTVLEDPEQESLRQLLLKEKRRFYFADMDGTPGLNTTEFLAFTHPFEVDYMADFAIEDVLNEYDVDKDGFITLTEFIGTVRNEGESPTQWEIEESVRFQDLYDQDQNGKLDRDEQLRWVAPNSYGSAREESLHLIKEMDQDGDGQLSVTEILQNQEIFINSEVTDYGRHLHLSHDEL
ncbi:reticulocalbin-2 [Xiphophorus hellerii]|uniref:reticulocalbin-2 n=1 Tax=Xiphophorus hellerii TaxID=8084 RepID=UPI0013B36A60|nr:reticulocalbin-2 [Xiphophorus hellerii]XP_032438946.1 reticulocalbin-2 [Xiphophorus hellerii]XP_032438954.1 reticulocalbin-2 [Xiphophorus hellerii]